jgi:hypothetical protein
MLSSQLQPTVSEVKLSAPGSASTVAGYSYYLQPITFTARSATGTVTSYSATITLVYEGGRWRLLGTSTPQPLS